MTQIRIHYIHDTLCGWCFVAHEQVEKIKNSLPENSFFEAHHLCLFSGSYQPELNDDMLIKVRRVGQEIAPIKTGVRVSDAHIAQIQGPGVIYNSELTAKAVAATEKLSPSKAYEFSRKLHKAVFETGLDFNDENEIANLWQATTGGNKETFLSTLKTHETQGKSDENAREAYALLQVVNTNGVPCLIAENNGKSQQLDPYNAEASIKILENIL